MRHNERSPMHDPPVEDDPVAREPVDHDRAHDAQLVAEARAGDQLAFGRLYDAWFDRVYNVSIRIVRDPEVAAEVAQDTFLSAWKNLGTLDSPEAFGGWLLRIARNASFNRHAREQRSSPVDDRGFAVIESTAASPSSAPTGFGVEERLGRVSDPARFAEDAEMVVLVRETAAALGERDAEVLDLQLRYGLSPAEIGEIMGMNRNAANQLVHRVKGRFATALGARVLWKGDRPACGVLDGLLRSAGVQSFDAEAVRIASTHAGSCSACGERQGFRLQPSALFAAVPILVAPALFKQQAAAALEAAGVPMSGSQHVSVSPTATSGGTTTGPVAEPATTTPDAGGATRRHLGRRVALMAVIVTALVAGVVAVLENGLHDDPVDQVATIGPATTVTSVPMTVPVTEPSTVGTTGVVTETITFEPPTTDPAPSEPPVSATAPPSAPPPAKVSSVALGIPDGPRARAARSYAFDGTEPRLTWKVTGEGSFVVGVTGPGSESGGGLPSSLASGSARLCPGSVVPDPNTGVLQCTAKAGSYAYTLIVRDGAGQTIAQAQATLVIV